MLRQVSYRNQRGKGGLKMKNALQVCLVIAICIWLIYQMTHSHGKKKIFEEGSDVEKFSKKDLSQMSKVEAIREIQSGDEEEIKEVEDEGEESTGEAGEEEEEEEAGHEELDEHDHDEATHKGGENEEASQAARERSFKADDASSAVAHATQSNEPETESENEAIWKNLDENAGGNNSSIVHQGISILQNHAVAKTVGAPMLHNISSQNETTVESKNEGQQPRIRVSSTMNNQTAADDLPVTLNHKIYFQNSTTVSVEPAESPANLTVKVDPNNVTISQYQTTVVHEQINTTKILSLEGEVPNLKSEAVRLEAGNSLVSLEKNRDVNIDALSSLDIQSEAQSSKPEAMAA
ncbi:uncharacterized protein LOC141837662 [Curcuma longa]|uniref:uncharacterized protein LOC141837662 n=1 Tax=Curcuma longa TaxID=136217 RepID=UPI003D9E6CBA